MPVADLPEPLNIIDNDWERRGPVPFSLKDAFEDHNFITLSDRQKIAYMTAVLRSWSWSDRPAGYIGWKTSFIARIFGETESWWKDNRAFVLADWVKCKDGNLYHPDLCAEAILRSNRSRTVSRLEISQSAWIKVRKQVFERDGYRCSYCGETPPILHCDHIIPVSRGGLSVVENLTTACASCNLSKSTSILEDWLQK